MEKYELSNKEEKGSIMVPFIAKSNKNKRQKVPKLDRLHIGDKVCLRNAFKLVIQNASTYVNISFEAR